MKKPFVSVVIPSLNEEKNIERCLKSIRDQEFDKPVEIILADGESADKTRKIAAKYVDEIVIERKHTIAAGRQLGCNEARGEIMVFTDADIYADKHWLANLTKPFEDSTVVCAYGTAEFFNPTWLEKIFAKPMFSIYLALLQLLGMPSGAGFNLAVRRSAFLSVKGFKTELVTAEDIELQKKLMKKGRIVFQPNAWVRVSPRRVRKWGTGKFLAFHLKNLVEIHLLNKSEKEYERIR